MELENSSSFAGILSDFRQGLFGHLVEGNIWWCQNSVRSFGIEDLRQSCVLCHYLNKCIKIESNK